MSIIDIDINKLSKNELKEVIKRYFLSKKDFIANKIKPLLSLSPSEDSCIICYEQCYTKTSCGHFICNSCNDSIIAFNKNNTSLIFDNQYRNVVDELLEIRKGSDKDFALQFHCSMLGFSEGILLYLSTVPNFHIYECPYCRTSVTN